jgi:hypothetical protein
MWSTYRVNDVRFVENSRNHAFSGPKTFQVCIQRKEPIPNLDKLFGAGQLSGFSNLISSA